MPTSHEPADYACPFCAVVTTRENGVNNVDDVVLRRPEALALIAPRWWPNNHGHVLVITTGHYENLYGLPSAAGHAVHDMVKDVAIAIRHTYGCEGVSTRQHNEPAGYQDVWHYHVHVFPRYPGDDLYRSRLSPGFIAPNDRKPFADKLRAYFAAAPSRANGH